MYGPFPLGGGPCCFSTSATVPAASGEFRRLVSRKALLTIDSKSLTIVPVNYKLFLSFLLVLLTVGSCRVDPPGEATIILVLDSNYRIGMREVLVGEQRELRFSLATSEARQCPEAKIEHRLYLEEQLLRLNLGGIAQPVSCTPATSDASTLTDQLALDDNLYKLRIELGESVANAGLLRLTPAGYSLELQTRTGIELESELLLRLPPDLVWGYVNFSESASANAIQQRVFSDLMNLGAQSVNLEKGYYGYFRTGNNESLLIPGAEEQGITFAYRLPGQDAAATLAALAEAWRTELGPTVTVGLFNTGGEVF